MDIPVLQADIDEARRLSGELRKGYCYHCPAALALGRMGMVTSSGMASVFRIDGQLWALDEASITWMGRYDNGDPVGPKVLKAERTS